MQDRMLVDSRFQERVQSSEFNYPDTGLVVVVVVVVVVVAVAVAVVVVAELYSGDFDSWLKSAAPLLDSSILQIATIIRKTKRDNRAVLEIGTENSKMRVTPNHRVLIPSSNCADQSCDLTSAAPPLADYAAPRGDSHWHDSWKRTVTRIHSRQFTNTTRHCASL